MPGGHVAPTVRRRRLGSELRKRRVAAGLTVDQAASSLGWDPSKVSRIETARQGIRPAEVTAVCALYGESDATAVDALIELARTAARRGWWAQYDILTPHYADYIDLESAADSVRTYQVSLVPGLFQTPLYARAVTEVTVPNLTEREITALVEVRQARQAVLVRPQPLKLWAIVNESVLTLRTELDPEVMRGQLRRLSEVAHLPNVTLQVMPHDATMHPGLMGSFSIVGFPLPAFDITVLESLTSTTYVESPAQMAHYVDAYETLRAVALPPEDSLQLIAKMKGRTQ